MGGIQPRIKIRLYLSPREENTMMKNIRIRLWMAAIVPMVFLWACGTAPKPAQSPAKTAQAEVARPSNPGGPGEAAALIGDPKKGVEIFRANCMRCHNAEGTGGIANPGSTDGTVPALNPIDPTLYSKDDKEFARNIDLFIEHGSTPEGKGPALWMPAVGEKRLMTQQQIADVIAYIIGLNKR
jgi:mono/diheme cytochrome c family protein